MAFGSITTTDIIFQKINTINMVLESIYLTYIEFKNCYRPVRFHSRKGVLQI